MKSREFRDRLLIAIYQSAAATDLGRYLKPVGAADAANLPRKVGQLRLALKALDSEGLINLHQTLGGGDEGGMDVQITAYGVERAEDLLEEYGDIAMSESDTDATEILEYVKTQTLEIEHDEVSNLGRLVTASNSGEELERAVALAEIAVFEAALSQPLIATDLINRFVNVVLKWIAKQFPDAVVQTVIAALIVKLAPFLAT